MTGINQNIESEETGWVETDADLIDWLDAVALCYGLTTREVAEHFLRYGAINHEELLD